MRKYTRALNKLTLILSLVILGSLLTLMRACSMSGGDGEITLASVTDVVQDSDDTPLPPADRDHNLPTFATVTVSGTVNGPSGAVSGVWIGVGAPEDWQEDITDGSGSYSVSIQTNGELWFHVRPDAATGLTQLNYRRDDVTASFTQNFTVTNGYTLSLQLTGTGGTPVTGDIWLEVQPLMNALVDQWWYNLDWDETSGRYRAILPPDVYYVRARHVPQGYYETNQPFDLQSADQIADLPLNTSYVHPIPYDPPDATKITIGSPDSLGEATVTGATGAALPFANVLLVNLNSAHQAHTTSDADGSFSARLYAPAGSAVMVKHGPPGHRWGGLGNGVAEGVNPYPGTIINLPHTHTGEAYELPFAGAGAVHLSADDANETRNYVGSAWSITGTLGPVVVDGEWTRILTGTYDGQVTPGLYLGGLNWTHPALGDLDNDNDLDLLVGERSGHLVFYRNGGTANSPDWRFETADFADVDTGDWAYPALADVTNDGALDLFVGAGSGTVSIYYNDGTPTAPAWSSAPDVSMSTGIGAAPALDDLDGDGDLDLLVGYTGAGETGKLYHFENTGSITAPTWTQRSDSYGSISEMGGLQPAFVNLDGDTDEDLLVGLCGQLIWYERGGVAANPTWTRQDSDPIGYGGGSCATSPGVGDWDGDSDDDVIIGEHWGNLRFFRNDGPPTWIEAVFTFPFDLAGDSAPALTDWDNDGDLDLLLGQAHGDVRQYTNVGTAASPDWRPDGTLLTLPWTNHPHPFPAFADIDADGDQDLFIGEGSWDGPDAGGTICFYLNTGTTLVPTWTLSTTSFLGLDVGGWSTPVFADIDDDEDLDLFVGDGAGALTFVQNTGTITEPTWAAPIRPYAGLDLGNYSAPAFFDVDQDGDLDMLVGHESGSLAYVRNTGTVISPAWELGATSYPGIDVGDRATPTAADVNGDGQPDLLIGDGDGGLNVYLYQGAGTPPTSVETFAAGDLIQIEGTMRLYSPAITTTTDVGAISADGWSSLMMLFDQDGQPLAAENYFMSTLLTPTGFPIQGQPRTTTGVNGHLRLENFSYVGDHIVEETFSLSIQLPDDLLPGTYRPLIGFDFTGVPSDTQWLAANVVRTTFHPNEAALPPIQVVSRQPSVASSQSSVVSDRRLIWRLLADDFVQGTRGTGAREDLGTFELASQIVSQGAPYYTPPVDVRTGQPITYRLEPFLPMISFTDRRMPTPPLIPFDLPGGQLQVSIREPDGTVRDLGTEVLVQSFNRTKTTRAGDDLNNGTTQLDDVYSLKAASDRFRTTFDQYGQHVITVTGVISDIWGNPYTGGGTYDLWIAHPLDIDPGVLPGTPLAVGDAFNPALQFYPRVPADVSISIIQYPNSDGSTELAKVPAQAITHTLTGRANLYGYFDIGGLGNWETGKLEAHSPITFTHPGEIRVDISAAYTDASGELCMGALTWGGIVMTPDDEADLVAHGRRGLDSLASIPGSPWFVFCRDLSISSSAVSHTFNPYFNGDIIWSRTMDAPGECPAGVASGGDSLLAVASVQDTVGTIEAAVQARADRVYPPLSSPGDFAERLSNGEIPLFSSTRSGRPIQMDPGDADQIAYSYRSSQRPGVRVREVVAEDGQTGGYWRLDTLYDDQLGVGVLGDQPNDFKFQYVGAVYRDLESGQVEYVGQGSGWIFIPDDDTAGSRVMPPFAGYGGWTAEGGPTLTLQGQEIHIFILPTGVRPGAVLQVGDVFHFAGHVMPTLDSRVAVTVTAPGGTLYAGGGQANSVGYFYNPEDDFVVDEPGLWSVDVRVWHDGQIGDGEQVLCATTPSEPCPTGDVLGSESGRYWFYVVPSLSPRLDVSTPSPGFLSFDDEVAPIVITGTVPSDLSGATVDYTISMPGYILEHGQVTPNGGVYQVTFDPATLHQTFPTLDLIGRDSWEGAGLSDTFAIGLLLSGEKPALSGAEGNGETVYRANTLTIQGQQVFIGDAVLNLLNKLFMPLILKGS